MVEHIHMNVESYLFELDRRQAEENIQDVIARQKSRDVSQQINLFLRERF